MLVDGECPQCTHARCKWCDDALDADTEEDMCDACRFEAASTPRFVHAMSATERDYWDAGVSSADFH